jgi:hypothetical protein
VELGRQPVGVTRRVASGAIGRCANVILRFTRSRLAVVASAAIGGGCERAVVNLGARPGGGRLMAGLTDGRGCDMV